MATPAAAYGAMLAGVDAVLMGAGIPRHLPHLLDELARHRTVRLPVDVAGDAGAEDARRARPGRPARPGPAPTLRRPMFLAIVSSDVLVRYLNRDAAIRPDGVRHRGPARRRAQRSAARPASSWTTAASPCSGPRDDADVAKVAAVGLPFWLAGGQGTPEALRDALAAGAAGVQVGTAFALSCESGLPDETAPSACSTSCAPAPSRCSPTRSPRPPASRSRSPSSPGRCPTWRSARPGHACATSGFLRTPFRKDDGRVGYRCPAEPVEMYVRKGGADAGHRAAGSACATR